MHVTSSSSCGAVIKYVNHASIWNLGSVDDNLGNLSLTTQNVVNFPELSGSSFSPYKCPECIFTLSRFPPQATLKFCYTIQN